MHKSFDPFGIVSSCWAVHRAWLTHPGELAVELAKLDVGLWSLEAWQRLAYYGRRDLIPAARYDERFQDPVWTVNPHLDRMALS